LPGVTEEDIDAAIESYSVVKSDVVPAEGEGRSSGVDGEGGITKQQNQEKEYRDNHDGKM
jgi:hypothetical protein